MEDDDSVKLSLGDNDEDEESSIGADSTNEVENTAFEDLHPAITETSVNVSATIMLKVPTYNLASLRQQFEAEPDGLNLYQFLKAFVANMELESEQDLISVVPDLVGADVLT